MDFSEYESQDQLSLDVRPDSSDSSGAGMEFSEDESQGKLSQDVRPNLGHLGTSLGHLGANLGHIGANVEHLGASEKLLDVILGPTWSQLWPY